MVVYSKIIIQKKKIKDIIHCLLWIPSISSYVTAQIENAFSQTVSNIMDTVPSQSIAPSTHASLRSCST